MARRNDPSRRNGELRRGGPERSAWADLIRVATFILAAMSLVYVFAADPISGRAEDVLRMLLPVLRR